MPTSDLAWVAAVLPEEIHRQRALGWPNFHPEDFCHRCGRRNPVWYADQEAWGTAVQGRDRGVVDILCPSCFVLLHEANAGERQGFLWHFRLAAIADLRDPGFIHAAEDRTFENEFTMNSEPYDWYPMHEHEGMSGKHSHHKNNGGHGSHEGVELRGRREACPGFVDYRGS